jgi:hypothetical protein
MPEGIDSGLDLRRGLLESDHVEDVNGNPGPRYRTRRKHHQRVGCVRCTQKFLAVDPALPDVAGKRAIRDATTTGAFAVTMVNVFVLLGRLVTPFWV